MRQGIEIQSVIQRQKGRVRRSKPIHQEGQIQSFSGTENGSNTAGKIYDHCELQEYELRHNDLAERLRNCPALSTSAHRRNK